MGLRVGALHDEAIELSSRQVVRDSAEVLGCEEHGRRYEALDYYRGLNN